MLLGFGTNAIITNDASQDRLFIAAYDACEVERQCELLNVEPNLSECM